MMSKYRSAKCDPISGPFLALGRSCRTRFRSRPAWRETHALGGLERHLHPSGTIAAALPPRRCGRAARRPGGAGPRRQHGRYSRIVADNDRQDGIRCRQVLRDAVVRIDCAGPASNRPRRRWKERKRLAALHNRQASSKTKRQPGSPRPALTRETPLSYLSAPTTGVPKRARGAPQPTSPSHWPASPIRALPRPHIPGEALYAAGHAGVRTR